MKFTQVQKIGFFFFICTLLPSYLIAQWRHDDNLATLTEQLEREQTLHTSTDKLLNNCERNEKREPNAFDANHQICTQGLQEHDHTTRVMNALEAEKKRNDVRWYKSFLLSVLFFNFLGFGIYKAITILKRDLNSDM